MSRGLDPGQPGERLNFRSMVDNDLVERVLPRMSQPESYRLCRCHRLRFRSVARTLRFALLDDGGDEEYNACND